MEGRDAASDRIVFPDVELSCRVGALPGESETPQPVRISLQLELDLRAAAASDRLADTLDYGRLGDALRAAVAAGPYTLLEGLAYAILVAVARVGPVAAATVTVEKSRPPLGEDIGPIAIELRRTREELQ